MKATGIVRKIDNVGRLSIPREILRVMAIELETTVEFLTDDGGLVMLRKYVPGCVFCGSVEPDMQTVCKRNVCRACIAGIRREEERD